LRNCQAQDLSKTIAERLLLEFMWVMLEFEHRVHLKAVGACTTV
jgi:hypothetical protein